ncbi:MAG TPA: hypothetical protein VF331_03240 [Polyangiales bacterium]|jgi:hypothetical protein
MADNPQPNAASTAAKSGSTAGRLAKGCGCTVALVVLGLGILWIGGFDSASWASAILGLVVAVGVFGLSGVNGWWER